MSIIPGTSLPDEQLQSFSPAALMVRKLDSHDAGCVGLWSARYLKHVVGDDAHQRTRTPFDYTVICTDWTIR